MEDGSQPHSTRPGTWYAILLFLNLLIAYVLAAVPWFKGAFEFGSGGFKGDDNDERMGYWLSLGVMSPVLIQGTVSLFIQRQSQTMLIASLTQEDPALSRYSMLFLMVITLVLMILGIFFLVFGALFLAQQIYVRPVLILLQASGFLNSLIVLIPIVRELVDAAATAAGAHRFATWVISAKGKTCGA